MDNKLKIGIILGSTREGRVSPQVGEWVLGVANERNNSNYELVDIKDYKLPLLGEGGNLDGFEKWQQKINELDGFVFIVSEYNHSISAALKNALDYLRDEWHNKAAGIISYGSTGGARAAEHLRGILGELFIADVRTHPTMNIFLDFENFAKFKPNEALHKPTINLMLDQLDSWATALKTIRK